MAAADRVYQRGERLRITIEAVVEYEPLDPGDPYDLAIGGGRLRLPLADPGMPVKVARLVPVGGEPRPGQIWRDRLGAELYATSARRRTGTDAVYLTDADGDSQ